jgi:hypothetical protein
MNRKQLLLLLVVLLVIGGAGVVLMKRNKESWTLPDSRMGDKVLPNFQLNEVAAIHIQGDTSLDLVRKNDVWRVQERADYPANFHQISDALIKVRDLKVVQSEPVSASELAQVNLEAPGKGAGSGMLVEFKDGQGKVLDSLILGKMHLREGGSSPFNNGSPDGRYVLLPGDPKNALLISEPLSSFVPRPEHWVSKDFIKMEKIKTISTTSANIANAWKVSRETESSPWALDAAKPGETLDTNFVSTVARMLAYCTFMDVLTGPAPADSGLDQPKLVTIETFDHFTYTLKIGSKMPEENYYMKVAVASDLPMEKMATNLQDKLKQEQAFAPWVYAVSSGIVVPLLRDRARIMVEKKDGNASATNPDSVKAVGASAIK